MRDYPFSFDSLNSFSNSIPYTKFTDDEQKLFDELNSLKQKYNFPAVLNDVGAFLSFMISFWRPRTIFEMGSGYGHSSFWYLKGDKTNNLQKIYLTEKRTDLQQEFHHLSWPQSWKNKLDYFQGDAFERLAQVENIDLALIDGVKADYLKFLKVIETKMQPGGIVVIDNSYWRGSFLDSEVRAKKKTAQHIFELHEYIGESQRWESIFLPFIDGVSILKLLS